MIPGPFTAGTLNVRPATVEDVSWLAPRLAPWDIVECLVHGLRPWAALHKPFEEGLEDFTWTLFDGDTPICMAGLVPAQAGAAIWLLGTEQLHEQRRPFLRLTRSWIHAALQQYSPLFNVVPERHEKAIRWLRWAGFDFDPAYVHFRGVRFLHFHMSRQDGPNSAPAP